MKSHRFSNKALKTCQIYRVWYIFDNKFYFNLKLTKVKLFNTDFDIESMMKYSEQRKV